MDTKIYPTKEEILAELYVPNEDTYLAVRKWKQLFFNGKWSTSNDTEKYIQLYELICAICVNINIERPEWVGTMDGWCYDQKDKTIHADISKLSIISALHELGHHVLGDSELQACRFSVGIFTKCFPATYKKLVWEGHMLKKPHEEHRENSTSNHEGK